MALYKEIKQEDGVVTNYHRILYITSTVNRRNSIAVLSYVDNDSRADEKNHIMAQPYRKAITYETAYTPDMTVQSAYDYLKTLSVFKDATDV